MHVFGRLSSLDMLTFLWITSEFSDDSNALHNNLALTVTCRSIVDVCFLYEDDEDTAIEQKFWTLNPDKGFFVWYPIDGLHYVCD